MHIIPDYICQANYGYQPSKDSLRIEKSVDAFSTCYFMRSFEKPSIGTSIYEELTRKLLSHNIDYNFSYFVSLYYLKPTQPEIVKNAIFEEKLLKNSKDKDSISNVICDTIFKKEYIINNHFLIIIKPSVAKYNRIITKILLDISF